VGDVLISLDTEYGGSVDLGNLATNYTLSRKHQKLVYVNPGPGLTLSLYDTTGLQPGGPYHYIINASPTNSIDLDADGGSPVLTISTLTVAIVGLFANGTWLGLTQPFRGISGSGTTIELDYGTVGAPTGTALDFGTVLVPTGPDIDLNLL